ISPSHRAGAVPLPLGPPRKAPEYPVAVAPPLRPATAGGAEVEVLAPRHVRKDAPAFRNLDEAARNDVRRPFLLDRRFIEPDAAAPRPHDARDGAIERRFAGAIRTQHRDDLAGPHGEIDAPQHLGSAVS